MSTILGMLRVISPAADAGRPAPGHWLPEQQLVFPLTQDVTTLGRDLHNAIVLFDPSVSAEHACLAYNHGAWTIEHLGDEGRVRVADVDVPPQMLASVAPGQFLRIGEVELQLVASDLPMSLMALIDENPAASSRGTNGTLTQRLQRLWRTPEAPWNRVGLVTLALGFCVALVLVILGLGSLITQRVISDGNVGVLAALMLPLVPVAGIATLTMVIDRYAREPWYLLLSAFSWGAIIAIPPAFFIENGLNQGISALPIHLFPRLWGDLSQSILYGLNAGITEEAVKGAGLLVLLFIVRDKFENITDGILYGAIIGAGFAMTENIAYFVTADSSRRTLVFLIIGRVILSWLGHSTFTACFGAGLGYMREGRGGFRPWLPPLLGFLAAVLLHSFFDFVDFQANTAVHDAPGSTVVNFLALVAVIADYIPLFVAQGILWVMLMRSLAREAGILREYLVDEVRQGLVTPEEYLALQQRSWRQRLQRELLLLHGTRFWLATRALDSAEVGLAFAKWRATLQSPESPPNPTSPAAYRRRIRHLRRTLRDLAEPPGHARPSSASLGVRK
jgi:RsiW-degrading membrane proteinase PrsW (M82 family)